MRATGSAFAATARQRPRGERRQSLRPHDVGDRLDDLARRQRRRLAYNGQVPGPRIHIRQGDRVRIDVHNALPEITTVHWHGLIVPNQMDGPAYVTQAPIEPGGSYSYAFTAVQHGTYFYHPHAKPDRPRRSGCTAH